MYCLKTQDGKVYVGSTKDLVRRMERHYRDLSKHRHHNHPLQVAYNNGDKFSLSFATCESRESAFTFEQMLITKHEEEGNLLNVGRHSRGGDNLTRHHERDRIIEQRTESQQLMFDNMTADERKVKYGRSGILNGMYGRTHTEEVRKANSLLHTGNSHRTGKKASAETKARMSEIASQRLGEKNSFFGKTHSDETKRRIAEARKGSKPVNTNRVEIDGVIYQSQADAAKALGVATATITHRIKSKNIKYSGYRVI